MGVPGAYPVGTVVVSYPKKASWIAVTVLRVKESGFLKNDACNSNSKMACSSKALKQWAVNQQGHAVREVYSFVLGMVTYIERGSTPPPPPGVGVVENGCGTDGAGRRASGPSSSRPDLQTNEQLRTGAGKPRVDMLITTPGGAQVDSFINALPLPSTNNPPTTTPHPNPQSDLVAPAAKPLRVPYRIPIEKGFSESYYRDCPP